MKKPTAGDIEVNIHCDTSHFEKMFEELRKCENNTINVPPRAGKANIFNRTWFWDLPGKKTQCKGCLYFEKYLVEMKKVFSMKPVGECSKLNIMVSKDTYQNGKHLKSCPLTITGNEADFVTIDDPLWPESYAMKKGMKP